MIKRYSKDYIFTARRDNASDASRLAQLKKSISVVNRDLRNRHRNESEYALLTNRPLPSYGPVQFRVCLKARLGKDNPAAIKYRNRGFRVQTIAMADASRYDVYVWQR
jgi:hypothetical protein